MRPSVMSAFGKLMSIGSSATNTRPSGAQVTTVGCLICGASATTSIFQSAKGCGRAEAATVFDLQKTTQPARTACQKATLEASRMVRSRDESINCFVLVAAFCDVRCLPFTAVL